MSDRPGRARAPTRSEVVSGGAARNGTRKELTASCTGAIRPDSARRSIFASRGGNKVVRH